MCLSALWFAIICKSVFVSHRCLDFQLQTLFWLAAQPHDCVNSSPCSQNRYVSQEPDKECFLTQQMKCKYSVKYYNKIKEPKTEVSVWQKSMLFYSEKDEPLTFSPVVHLVDTRWSSAPLRLPSTWSISSFWQNIMSFPLIHRGQRLQKFSCFYDRSWLIFRLEFDSELYIKTYYLLLTSFFLHLSLGLSFTVNSRLLRYFLVQT